MEAFHQAREHALRITRSRQDDGFNRVGLMRSIQHPEKFSNDGAQRPLVESDRDGLPLHRVEDAQTAVAQDRRLGGIGRKLPLEGAVRFAAAANMLTQVGPRIDQFRVGIFHSA